MGYYINTDSKGGGIPSDYEGKIRFIENDGGFRIPAPLEWKEGLVCIVDNGPWAAAGYAYCEGEMKVFKTPDGRRRTWMYYKNAKEVAA